jgi:hypothetical protein
MFLKFLGLQETIASTFAKILAGMRQRAVQWWVLPTV